MERARRGWSARTSRPFGQRQPLQPRAAAGPEAAAASNPDRRSWWARPRPRGLTDRAPSAVPRRPWSGQGRARPRPRQAAPRQRRDIADSRCQARHRPPDGGPAARSLARTDSIPSAWSAASFSPLSRQSDGRCPGVDWDPGTNAGVEADTDRCRCRAQEQAGGDVHRTELQERAHEEGRVLTPGRRDGVQAQR